MGVHLMEVPQVQNPAVGVWKGAFLLLKEVQEGTLEGAGNNGEYLPIPAL